MSFVFEKGIYRSNNHSLYPLFWPKIAYWSLGKVMCLRQTTDLKIRFFFLYFHIIGQVSPKKNQNFSTAYKFTCFHVIKNRVKTSLFPVYNLWKVNKAVAKVAKQSYQKVTGTVKQSFDQSEMRIFRNRPITGLETDFIIGLTDGTQVQQELATGNWITLTQIMKLAERTGFPRILYFQFVDILFWVLSQY